MSKRTLFYKLQTGNSDNLDFHRVDEHIPIVELGHEVQINGDYFIIERIETKINKGNVDLQVYVKEQ